MTSSGKPSRDAVNKIFGEVFPQESADEREIDSTVVDAERDEWWRNNIPPHHE